MDIHVSDTMFGKYHNQTQFTDLLPIFLNIGCFLAIVVKQEICPKCGKKGRVRSTWVKNKSKKIYYYKIYIHDGTKHYVNTSIDNYKLERTKKDELQLIILNRLSKITYFNRQFTARELFEDLKSNSQMTNYTKVRRILIKFTKDRIITKKNVGKKILFSLAPEIIGRLFEITTMEIFLENNNVDKTYRRLVSIFFRNITSFPLEFYPFVIRFDEPTNLSQVQIAAFDVNKNIPLKTKTSAINNLAMFVYIKFDQPLNPNEEKKLKFLYEVRGLAKDFYFATSYKIRELTICVNTQEMKNIEFFILPKGEIDPFLIDKRLIKAITNDSKMFHCYKTKYDSESLIQIKWS